MSFTKYFNINSDSFITHLRKQADGKTKINLLKEFSRAAVDLIAAIGFSMHLDTINDRNSKIIEDIKNSFDLFQMVFENPLAVYNPFYWGNIRKQKKSIRSIRQICRQNVLKRIDDIKNDDPVPNDILTIVLKTILKDSKEVDLEHLIDQFITLFVAGAETSATTLSFIFRDLCRNPDVFEKVRNEVDTVIGLKSLIEYQDLSELKYTGAVIKESLRFYPVASFSSRTSNRDVKLDKFTVPINTCITTSGYISSRREENFSEPLKFKPERFLNKNENTEGNSFAYFPFSLGPRNCIGQNFAMMDIKIMIVKLIQNFDFKLDPNERMLEDLTLTLRPTDGTNVYITLRNN